MPLFRVARAPLAALAFTGVAAGAQENADDPPAASPFETIVVTGTGTGEFGLRSGIPLEQVPQSVQVLDESDLRERGVRDIGDALRAVPSANPGGSRFGGSASFNYRIRGFAPDIMRNGMRQRYYEDVDASALSNVARVEVLKGPSAALYGESAIGGIVSIVTKQPGARPAASAALTAGMFDQATATLDAATPLTATLGLRVTGEIERSGSFVDFLELDRENVALSLAWRPGASVAAHLVAEYVRRTAADYPGLPAVGTVIANGIGKVARSAYLGEPGYSRQESHAPLIQAWVDLRLADRWTVTPRFQYSEFNNWSRGIILGPPLPGQPSRIQRQGRSAGENDRFYIGQVDVAGQAAAFGSEHAFLLGAEYSNEEVPFRMRGEVPCGIGPIDALSPAHGCGPPTERFGFLSVNRVEGIAVYAQDRIDLAPGWSVVAGIRRSWFETRSDFVTDFFSTTGRASLSNTTWQLGTTLALGGGLSAFGGYNTGFDLEYMLGARRRDGTPFQPETSDQAEMGLRIRRDALRASVSAFRIRRNDVAVPDPADPGFQRQEGQLRVRGVELEGEWLPRPGWSIQGGYAYLDGEVARSSTAALVGARLAETPRHAATVFSRVQLGSVELRAGGRYTGSRKVVNGGALTLPGYMLLNLGVGTGVGRFRVDAALSNLLDETYYHSANGSVYSVGTEDIVFPGEPRTLSVRVSYALGGTPGAGRGR